MTTCTASAAVAQMRTLLGMRESPANQNAVTRWFSSTVCNIGAAYPWCQASVMYALAHAGYDLKANVEDTVPARWMAWTVGVALGAQKRGQWHVGTSGIRMGDVPYYNWNAPYGAAGIAQADHTGMVERVVDSSHRYVIEGNIGDEGRRELRDNRYIVGYWRPAYAPETSSAPAKPGKPGTVAPAFPLPRGSYFGPKSGGNESVSGYYSHGADLARWQSQMRARGWHLSADGRYGPETAKIARAFQADKHLTVDGEIGPQTWAAAWTAPVTK